MKRIFLLVLALCLFCVSAAASPKLYRHPQYDFSNLRNVKVTVIKNAHPENSGNFHAEEMAEEKVLSALYSAAGARGLILTDERSGGPIAPTGEQDSHLNRNKNAPKTVEVRITLNYLGYNRYLVPAHYEQKTEYFKQKRKDSSGRERIVEIPIPTQVWVPDAYLHKAVVDIIYNAYDLETAAVIANVMDKRVREAESDPSSMLGRSAKDFLKALTKK
ncbi:MAG: hypothetical protein ACI3WS_07035 [Phascolarctobacterium sp.]